MKVQTAQTLALAAAAAGLNGYNTYSSLTDKAGNFSPKKAQDISVNISIGSSKSQSNSNSQSDSARGSTVTAGNDISITATGAGKDSNLTVQGSEITAGNNVTLNADNQINLQAAKNTASQTSSNSSSSSSVGVSYSPATGWGVNASASRGQGRGNGSDVSYTNTQVQAGNTAAITSGGDTNIKGAVVAGNTIKADVGGNLAIESLQDTSTYTSRQSSSGGSISFGGGKLTGGGISVGRSNIDSNFASVNQQSGIQSGDGGFQVSVNNNTDLKGSVIASTQTAIDQNRNSFTTGGNLSTSDIQNSAEYKGEAIGVSASIGPKNTDPKGNTTYLPGVGFGISSDKGNASSTTTAGISGIAGNTVVRTGDAQTGIAPIFDAAKVQREIDAQVQITQEFGKNAAKAVGDYAQAQQISADQLRAQAQAIAQSDPQGADALNAQAEQIENNWGNNGILRLAAHTVIGGLTGGASGAAGAAAGTLTAPAVDRALADAGITGPLASILTAVASTAVGAATGGTAGSGAALNEVANNYLNHNRPSMLGLSERERYENAVVACNSKDQGACDTRDSLAALSAQRDRDLQQFCAGGTPEQCNVKAGEAIAMGNIVYGQNGQLVYANSPESGPIRFLNVATISAPVRPDSFHDRLAQSTAEALILETGDEIAGAAIGLMVREAIALGKAAVTFSKASMDVTINLLENMGLRNVQVGAINNFSTAEAVNATMRSVAGWEPAWQAGTVVTDLTLKQGSRVSMVVDAETYALLSKPGSDTSRAFGGWGTYDNVTSQAYARNQLAITPSMKPNVGYVIEVEITKPVRAQVGVVGAQGSATGGGNQLHFVVPLPERSTTFQYVPNSGRALP